MTIDRNEGINANDEVHVHISLPTSTYKTGDVYMNNPIAAL